MKRLRGIPVVLLVFAGAAQAGPKLELEVGGGVDVLRRVEPTLRARVGLDLFDLLTPSVKLVSLTPWNAERRNLGVYFELRAHTRGVLQLQGGVAAGLLTSPGVTPTVGEVGEAATGGASRLRADYLVDLGLRVRLGPVFVGATAGYAPAQQQLFATATLGLVLFDG